ncbi:unnamed protein product [Clonostachys rosea f. rosea IK726]|uniref:Uncharacterized protein n=1 Tax=Clonostachys rosea f. rosea IK726 TaxID=1349383 RepID=A0ACA9T8M4_BIOOC|nr:unnamed protein product [Clonostachys rosea f. rosea IK726]
MFTDQCIQVRLEAIEEMTTCRCWGVKARANQDEAQISQHAMAGKTSFNIEITSSQNQVAEASL